MKQIVRVGELLTLFVSMVLLSCAVRPYYEIEPQKLADTYTGTSADGERIVLQLQQGENGWVGNGTFGANKVVFVESGTKKAIGKLIFSDGTVQPVSLELSEIGDVSLELAGQVVDMQAGGKVTPPETGPFSGHFETKDMKSFVDAFFLTQSGEIVSGTAIVLQQKALVSGWVTAPNNVYGIVTLPGETQMEFEASLDGDNKLIVSGLGNPVIFQRK